jgi:hypothetical protein
MREHLRSRVIASGLMLIISILAGKALLTLISGRLMWKNYWEGLVFAPLVLLAVVLLLIVTLKHHGSPKEGTHRRKR